MAILQRVSHLVGADLHALLDLVEDPQTLLAQGLRDMDAAITDLEAETARLDAERRTTRTAIEHSESGMARLDEQLDLCFAEDRPDLARTLVRRKLTQARRLEAAVDRLRDIDNRHVETVALLAERRGHLAELRARAEDAMHEPSRDFPTEGIDEHAVEIALLAERAARRRS